MSERIESARTIPSRLYVDPQTLEQERLRVFHRTWQLVGRTDQDCGNGRTLAQPESYFATEVAGEPVVIARDAQGVLRGFFNVCRHRAGPVAEGAGCGRVLQCKYHGWTYTLDGRLIGTPDVGGEAFFDRNAMGLAPVRLATWEQFIFVNLDGAAPPLQEFLEDIPEQVARWQVSRMGFVQRKDYFVECNWKVYIDNYLEGYHIPIAHPGLMKEIDYANYRTVTHRYYSRQFAPLRPAAAGDGQRFYTPGTGASDDAFFVWMFPNLMLNIYPDNLQTNVVLPLGHNRTQVIFEWYAHEPDSAQTRQTMTRALELAHQVQLEDQHLCEAVQKGLRSVSYDRGIYAPKRENGVHHFHLLLQEFLK